MAIIAGPSKNSLPTPCLPIQSALLHMPNRRPSAFYRPAPSTPKEPSLSDKVQPAPSTPKEPSLSDKVQPATAATKRIAVQLIPRTKEEIPRTLEFKNHQMILPIQIQKTADPEKESLNKLLCEAINAINLKKNIDEKIKLRPWEIQMLTESLDSKLPSDLLKRLITAIGEQVQVDFTDIAEYLYQIAQQYKMSLTQKEAKELVDKMSGIVLRHSILSSNPIPQPLKP